MYDFSLFTNMFTNFFVHQLLHHSFLLDWTAFVPKDQSYEFFQQNRKTFSSFSLLNTHLPIIEFKANINFFLSTLKLFYYPLAYTAAIEKPTVSVITSL